MSHDELQVIAAKARERTRLHATPEWISIQMNEAIRQAVARVHGHDSAVYSFYVKSQKGG